METPPSPRIMVLGHSFVWRIAKCLAETSLPCVSVNFHLTMTPTVHFHGIGGRTVTKLRQFDLSAVAEFNPNVLIIETVPMICAMLRPVSRTSRMTFSN